MTWLIRPYDRDIDENGVVYMWLTSMGQSRYGRSLAASGLPHASKVSLWSRHKPLVLRLLETATTTILCDPEEPAAIWAFACVEPWAVHMAVVKRRFADYAPRMIRALIPDHLDMNCFYTHQLTDLEGWDRPAGWVYDPYLLARTT